MRRLESNAFYHKSPSPSGGYHRESTCCMLWGLCGLGHPCRHHGTKPIVWMRTGRPGARPRAQGSGSAKVTQLRDACPQNHICLEQRSERHQDRQRERVSEKEHEEGDPLSPRPWGNDRNGNSGLSGSQGLQGGRDGGWEWALGALAAAEGAPQQLEEAQPSSLDSGWLCSLLVTVAPALSPCPSWAQHQSQDALATAPTLPAQLGAESTVPTGLGPELGGKSEDLGLGPCSATVRPQASRFPSLGYVSKMVEHFPDGSISGVVMLSDNSTSSEKAPWCHLESTDSGVQRAGGVNSWLPPIHSASLCQTLVWKPEIRLL